MFRPRSFNKIYGVFKIVTIKQRLKQVAYKKKKLNGLFDGESSELKNEDVVFLICDELKEDDFKEPFFKGVVNLYNGFKFLSYCGKHQRGHLNKNALVIQKKLSKDNKVLYRVYLMDKDGFSIRDLFSEFGQSETIGKHNGYNLSPHNYMKGKIKEEYEKEELIYTINQIQNKLVGWSLEQ